MGLLEIKSCLRFKSQKAQIYANYFDVLES